MITAPLMGTEWLDAQRVEYTLVPVKSTETSALIAELHIAPAQLLSCDLFIGEKEPALVVHAHTHLVNLQKLATHVGDKGFRPANAMEIQKNTHQSGNHIHPFIEGYLWKVLDERIFDQDVVYLRMGNTHNVLRLESTALKYTVGVINGIIADVCVA